MMSRTNKLVIISILLTGLLFLTIGCGDDSSETSSPDRTMIDFTEDFSEAHDGWSTSDSAESSRSYLEGENKYEIRIKTANWVAWSYAPVEKLSSEYTIKADVTLTEINAGESGRYGLVFNAMDNSDFYRYDVNPITKHYRVVRKVSGEWKTIVDWTKNESINTPTNTLKLTQNGSEVELYVNGEKLIQTGVVERSVGVKVGILASSLGDESYLPIAAQFDRFEVSGYAAE